MAIAPRHPDELLRDVPVLSGLPAADLDALAAAAEQRKAARGEPLFQEGLPAEGLMVVSTGEVKLVKSAKDGREQILYLARPGRPITEGVRFDGGVYPASAVAMRATTALLIPNQVLSDLGERRPGVLRALVDLRARRVDRLLVLISDLSLRTVPARLASFLCTLSAQRTAHGEESRTLVRDLTTETVAARLGTVREEISRALAYLEREGAIKVSPDVVVIEDLARLEAIAYESRRS
jgi:CRP-like cAMP-binding protein